MKSKIISVLFVCLYMNVMFSCVTQRHLYFARQVELNATNNSVESNGKSILKVTTSVLNFKDKKLIFEKDLLSKNQKKYISTILQECHSNQDTIIAVSPDFIVLKNQETNQKLDINYMYHLNFDTSRWVCSYVDITTGYIPFVDEPCAFLRRIYVVKQRNRIIVKDYFRDISVIYVIQGKDNKTDFYTTTIWSPADFSTLITTTNYIRERIDPVSQDITRHKMH